MKIEVDGDALRILEHFIFYATGCNAKRLSDAMYYKEDGFRLRARSLEKAFHQAMADEYAATDTPPTRSQRKNAVLAIIRHLESIADAETSFFESIPDTDENCELSFEAEQTIAALDEALQVLAGAF